jgi:endonuclease-3
MKHGTHYARRVKKLHQEIVRKFGKPDDGEPADPVDQLVIGILASCTSLTRAQNAYRKLRQEMVDLNELRVTPAVELAELIADSVPLAEEKARRVVAALNAVRKLQDALDLSFLKQRGRREAREYLESLDGVDPAVAAWVVVGSLGGHAIPVDLLTVYILRKDEIVDENANVAEVQGFLERHISASDARAFSDLLSRYVSSKSGRVDLVHLGQLLNPAPAPQPPPAAETGKEPPSAATEKPKLSKARPGKVDDAGPARAKESAAPPRAASATPGKKPVKVVSAKASGGTEHVTEKAKKAPRRKR